MKRATLFAAILMASAAGALAQPMSEPTVRVRRSGHVPVQDIVDNAVNSADHTTLVAAVKAAGLVDTLKGKGPFTVFAPVNSAFNELPAGTVNTLLKPENKATLTHILTYHVVAGNLDMAELAKRIQAGGGKTELTTVSGGKLWLMMNGPHNIQIKDEKGDVADISTYDVTQSNGVIHVIEQSTAAARLIGRCGRPVPEGRPHSLHRRSRHAHPSALGARRPRAIDMATALHPPTPLALTFCGAPLPGPRRQEPATASAFNSVTSHGKEAAPPAEGPGAGGGAALPRVRGSEAAWGKAPPTSASGVTRQDARAHSLFPPT